MEGEEMVTSIVQDFWGVDPDDNDYGDLRAQVLRSVNRAVVKWWYLFAHYIKRVQGDDTFAAGDTEKGWIGSAGFAIGPHSAVTDMTTKTPLTWMEPGEILTLIRTRTERSQPLFYSMSGLDGEAQLLLIWPPPDFTRTIRVDELAGAPSISDASSGSNLTIVPNDVARGFIYTEAVANEMERDGDIRAQQKHGEAMAFPRDFAARATEKAEIGTVPMYGAGFFVED